MSNVHRDPSAWNAEDQRWYASLVAYCNGFGHQQTVQTALAQMSQKPWSECMCMVGDAALDYRVEDCRGRMWSTAQTGRWFATVDRKVVWLQRELLRIGCGQLPREGEVVSHLCGNCDCIRWQHLRVQSRSEDARDRIHHKARGKGKMRPRAHVPESPVTMPNPGRKSKRLRSPCYE